LIDELIPCEATMVDTEKVRASVLGI